MLPTDWNLRLVDLDVTNLHDSDIEWADWIFLLRPMILIPVWTFFLLGAWHGSRAEGVRYGTAALLAGATVGAIWGLIDYASTPGGLLFRSSGPYGHYMTFGGVLMLVLVGIGFLLAAVVFVVSAVAIPLIGLAVIIATHLVVLLLTSIYVSLQGGSSIFLIWKSAPFFDVLFSDARNGVVIGAYGSYYTTSDGGDTWEHQGEAVFGGRCFSRIVVDHANPQVVYAAITRAGGFPELAAALGVRV